RPGAAPPPRRSRPAPRRGAVRRRGDAAALRGALRRGPGAPLVPAQGTSCAVGGGCHAFAAPRRRRAAPRPSGPRKHATPPPPPPGGGHQRGGLPDPSLRAEASGRACFRGSSTARQTTAPPVGRESMAPSPANTTSLEPTLVLKQALNPADTHMSIDASPFAAGGCHLRIADVKVS